LKLLKEDANVYKLVGPTMLKQDLVEAGENVTKRIEFIKGEVYERGTNVLTLKSGVVSGLIPCARSS